MPVSNMSSQLSKQLYSLLPLSVTFNIDSHWFKCDTIYHQGENSFLLNMKIWQQIEKFLSNFDKKTLTVTLTFDIESLVFTFLPIKMNISTKYYEITTITCEKWPKQDISTSIKFWPLTSKCDLDLWHRCMYVVLDTPAYKNEHFYQLPLIYNNNLWS